MPAPPVWECRAPPPPAASQERRHQPQVRGDAEQHRRKDRGPHDQVEHGNPPAAGFALNAADVKIESEHCIREGEDRHRRQHRAPRAAAAEPGDACRQQRGAQNHGRVHNAAAVAAAVVFVRDFEPAEHARGPSHQRQPALKPPFAHPEHRLACQARQHLRSDVFSQRRHRVDFPSQAELFPVLRPGPLGDNHSGQGLVANDTEAVGPAVSAANLAVRCRWQAKPLPTCLSLRLSVSASMEGRSGA